MTGLALVSFWASAQSVRVDFEEYDLKNGLHVILHEDHATPNCCSFNNVPCRC